MEKYCSRRSLLTVSAKGAAALLATAALGPGLLSGCKRKSPPSNIDKKDDIVEAKSISCPNQDTLSDQDKSIRASLKYVDQTPIADRRCDNCKLYTLPIAGALCGGCKVVPGPIHPRGHCTAWLQLM